MKPGNAGRVALALALAAGLLVAFANREALSADAISRWLTGAGAWAPLAFIAFYAAATVLFLPGAVLTLAAGALFGAVPGALYSLTGAPRSAPRSRSWWRATSQRIGSRAGPAAG